MITVNAQTGEVAEREMTAEEIAQMEAMQTEVQPEPQLTLEQRVADIEQVTSEVITALNEKGIVSLQQ
jgi:hypothetical protein